MTSLRVGFVDVYPYRGRDAALEFLLLRRAAGRSRAGSWEAVHGRIDPGELPVAAARREVREETGCEAEPLYNLSRVEQLYLHADDEVILVPVFAVELPRDAAITLSAEHDEAQWLPLDAAQARCTWPRAARALEDVARLLGAGGGGSVEAVLRVGPTHPKDATAP